ncbi:undecaprenyldiphospho-muramoylpentapeptide beta-N-acetylglucosaminyltransferase [Fundicoccus sp. Sow4_D5]|uniref:undecaprenyldiphospho-muramoylpentapeptide beta-N-acetylglucosaminyltransferase n=1 Tax=Fundicoccus sp. Sow4_D5 TaxID=3438782 RepID=UPI003F939173
MKEIKRIVLSGGGTGGHIYPALALYREIQAKYPNVECLYIGTEKGLEASIVPKAGLAFKSIDIQGLKRSLSPENIKAVWLMMTSTKKAKKLLAEFKPDVVIGTGGYVCAPVLYAAASMKIPSMIHEQNSVAGITNKFLSRSVDIIATCFPEVEKDFTKYADKIRYTGNPRGQEVIQSKMDATILKNQFGLSPSLSTVLVFGGSRGAPAINEAAFTAIDNWSDKNYQVIIATGTIHYEDFLKTLADKKLTLPNNIKVVPYIDNMPAVFQAIDLVICRSGATTLTELTALGLPSILIPSPFVTNNHQEANALSLVNNGAAKMIKQADLTGDSLFNFVDEIIKNPNQLASMKQAALALGIIDASDRLIKEIETLIS